jgi:Transcriptional regulator, AbiEi antitoxin, Type IV TA system/Transcriptional regulator, AbiEi antitoxin N-terminal domain
MQTKINHLLQSLPPGVVFLASWLEMKGYSRELQRRYVKTGWLKPIGRGALVREGQAVNWLGALYSIQNQTEAKIHIGGLSALNLLGMAHYLELNTKKIQLFAPRATYLPSWFREYNWGVEFIFNKTNFLPPDIGMSSTEEKSFTVITSGPARALLECLFLSPAHFSLPECYNLMEGLTTLHPDEVQGLLEKCKSVKVVRLFLYMAWKAKHSWVKHLDMSIIKTGKGKRSIVIEGVYIPEYQITIPEELFKM